MLQPEPPGPMRSALSPRLELADALLPAFDGPGDFAAVFQLLLGQHAASNRARLRGIPDHRFFPSGSANWPSLAALRRGRDDGHPKILRTRLRRSSLRASRRCHRSSCGSGSSTKSQPFGVSTLSRSHSRQQAVHPQPKVCWHQPWMARTSRSRFSSPGPTLRAIARRRSGQVVTARLAATWLAAARASRSRGG
jgi:hypothetical protein